MEDWKMRDQAEGKMVQSSLGQACSFLEQAGYPIVGKSAFSCIAKPMSPLILSRPDIATAVPLNCPLRTFMQSSPVIESTT